MATNMLPFYVVLYVFIALVIFLCLVSFVMYLCHICSRASGRYDFITNGGAISLDMDEKHSLPPYDDVTDDVTDQDHDVIPLKFTKTNDFSNKHAASNHYSYHHSSSNNHQQHGNSMGSPVAPSRDVKSSSSAGGHKGSKSNGSIRNKPPVPPKPTVPPVMRHAQDPPANNRNSETLNNPMRNISGSNRTLHNSTRKISGSNRTLHSSTRKISCTRSGSPTWFESTPKRKPPPPPPPPPPPAPPKMLPPQMPQMNGQCLEQLSGSRDTVHPPHTSRSSRSSASMFNNMLYSESDNYLSDYE